MGCWLGPKHKKIKMVGQSIIAGGMIIGGVAVLSLGILIPLGSALIAAGVALVVPFSVSPFQNKQKNKD